MAILRSPYAHANIHIDRHRGGRGDARRRGRPDRRGHPVQPAADGLAGRWFGRDPEQHQHAACARDGQRQVDRRGCRGGDRRDARAGRPTRSRRSHVDWEPLPAVVDAEKATQPGAPQLHENAPNNVVFEWTVGDKAGTDAAIDAAEVVVRQRIVNQRLIPNPMEVRGDIGLYNPGTDEYTVWMSSQTPHIQRLLLTAFVTGIPEHKVRCISPDVGGAFGTKIFCYADMALVMLASKRIGGRPVKWVETRRENYQSTTHGRDHITYLEIAGTRDGEITGLRVKTLRQPRRPPVDDRPGHPDDPLRPRPGGLLQDPQRLLRGDRRLHEHDVRRRLPRRRPARGDLRHRAGDGPVRRRDRDGPGGDPAQELHPARRSSRTRTRPGSARPRAARRSTSTRATTSRPSTRP